jgi:hypothetical protein
MAIEEPKYTVESKMSEFEIRLLSPVVVAETLVTASFEDSGNRAFRILADYIFGNNESRTKIEMTAPVSQVKSEKIAMTAPVTLSKAGLEHLVQFTLPAQYTLTSAPRPKDSRVTIREMPARRIAVRTYSGSWSEERYNENLSELRKQLAKAGLETLGEPVFARYNSPLRLWFLRRNEIWLQLK